MKRLALIVFFSILALISFSQRVYFLYIQSENEQPFYLKMNERIYSSASKGYLILSNLRDSTYHFSIGLPGKNIIEQQFAVSTNAKDHGYVLKNFNEKGWGLFDLQTMSIQMSRPEYNAAVEMKRESVKKDESLFTQILAKASDDSTLLEKPDLTQLKEQKKDAALKDVVKQPEQKIEEKKTEIKPPETVDDKKSDKLEEKPVVKIEQSPVVIKVDSIQKSEEVKTSEPEIYKRSEIIRKSEGSTPEGFDVTFIDEYDNGKRDTIIITIPQAKEAIESGNKQVQEEKKFLDIVDSSKQQIVEPTKEDTTNNQSQTESKAIKKKNCQSIADEDDFFKLRKKMAGIPEDDNMIREAVKTFKTRCFSTEQLKNLSTLFLSDGGKYKFFDAAYDYVFDIENFSSLQSELKSDYYQNRFKAMLR